MPKSSLEYDNQVQCLRLAIAVIREWGKAVLRPTRKNRENIGRLEVEKRVGGPFADLQEHHEESDRTEAALLPIKRGSRCVSRPPNKDI